MPMQRHPSLFHRIFKCVLTNAVICGICCGLGYSAFAHPQETDSTSPKSLVGDLPQQSTDNRPLSPESQPPFQTPPISTLSLQDQQELLADGLTNSLIHGTVQGLVTPEYFHPLKENSPNISPSILAHTTWKSWFMHTIKRWMYIFHGQWHDLRHLEQSPIAPELLEPLVDEIGMALVQNHNFEADQIISNPNTSQRLHALFVQDSPVFETLLALYTQLVQNRGIANDQILVDDIDKLFAQDNVTLDHRTKLIIYATLLPHFIEHARGSNAQVTARKLTETQQTLHRLLQNSRYVITCRENASQHHAEITFSPDLLMPGTSGAYQIHTHDVTSDRFPATRVTCQITETQDSAIPLHIQFQQALDHALEALTQKETDAITMAMHQLHQTLRAFAHAYPLRAIWHDNLDTRTSQWLCQLQIITLLALEQHRFVELATLERDIQNTFSNATFYQRLMQQSACSSELNDNDKATLVRLTQDHQKIYDWILHHYAQKHRKNFSKNFSKWTRKNKPNIALERRLLAAWTFWSDGDYTKAASYAGPHITQNKPRVVHPQLHSFDLILRAIRKEELKAEELESYMRVIQLKAPALAFQTLSEAYPWFTDSQRQEIVDMVSQSSPNLASFAAARFYQTYETVFHLRLDASKRAAMGTWLESELRLEETPIQTQKRREQWLKDIQESGNPQALQTLYTCIQKDWDHLSPTAQTFWSKIEF